MECYNRIKPPTNKNEQKRHKTCDDNFNLKGLKIVFFFCDLRTFLE